MTNMINLLLNSSIYKKMLEQVPEEEREEALKELAESLEPMGALLASFPGSVDIFSSMLSDQQEAENKTSNEPTRRLPRRF
jgi:hypothetical protein